jgi:hypothetical protein
MCPKVPGVPAVWVDNRWQFKMKAILNILFLILTLSCFGQDQLLEKSAFYALRIHENEWRCLPGFDGFDRNKTPSFASSNFDSITVSSFIPHKLNVVVSELKYDSTSNEVELKGIVKGGWYGAKSAVKIYVGTYSVELDSIFIRPRGRYIYIDGEKVDNEYKSMPIGTSEGLHLRANYVFETPDAHKDESENRPFDIKFKINEDDIIAFGLWDCYAEIFRIGKIKTATNNTYKK